MEEPIVELFYPKYKEVNVFIHQLLQSLTEGFS